MSDTITVLVADHEADHYKGLYQKAVLRRGDEYRVVPRPMPTRHKVAEIEVEDLADFHRHLQRMRRQPDRCVILGRLRDAAREKGGPYRRSLDNFEDTRHNVFGGDIDGAVLPARDVINWREQGDAAVQWIIANCLPECFHGARVSWSWTSGQGFKPGARLRAWWWLADPMTVAEQRAWQFSWGTHETEEGRTVPIIPLDPAVFRPVQPIYTADPKFGPGVDQAILPARLRTGFIEGHDLVLDMGPHEVDPAHLRVAETWDTVDRVKMTRRKAARTTPIGFVNAVVAVDEALEMAGYVHAGKRYLYPGSDSGIPGVVVKDGHCWSHHDGDPLADGAWHDAYDVLSLWSAQEEDAEDERLRVVLDFAYERGMTALADTYFVQLRPGKDTPGASFMVENHDQGYRWSNLSRAGMATWFESEPFYIMERDNEGALSLARKNPGKVFWGHEYRKNIRGIIMDPNKPFGLLDNGYFNQFRGYPIKPKYKPGATDMYHQLLREVICCGNVEEYEWLLDRLAAHIQDPTVRYGTAIVTRGKQGTGKSSAARYYAMLFGEHALTIDSSKHLVGNFNAHLDGKLVLVAEEAVWGGDKQHEGRLKNLITGETLVIERKGVDAVEVPNYLLPWIISNEGWVVPATIEDRRFYISTVLDALRRNNAWFARLEQQMLHEGGLEMLMWEFLNREITHNLYQPPHTQAKVEMAEYAMAPEEAYFRDLLAEGRMRSRDEIADVWVLSSALNGNTWMDWVVPAELYQHFLRWFDLSYRRSRFVTCPTQRMFGIFVVRLLKEAWRTDQVEGPGGVKVQRGTGEQRHWGYRWPTIEQLRNAFDVEVGKLPWNAPLDDQHYDVEGETWDFL